MERTTTIAMERIAAAALADTFELTDDAIAGTISVYVNGVQQLTGWSLDANSNSVVFDPSCVPNDGDVVQINYGYCGAC